MLRFQSLAIIVALAIALIIQLRIWDLLGIVAFELCGCVKCLLLSRSSIGFAMRSKAIVSKGAAVPVLVILADNSPHNVELLRILNEA